jgi:uncharacterized membrane protein YccC
MTEPKVSLDDAVTHISATLSLHAETIKRLQQTLDTVEPTMEALRTSIHLEIRDLETNLITFLDSKDTLWNQATDDMKSLTTNLSEIRNLFATRFLPNVHTTAPSSPHPDPPHLIFVQIFGKSKWILVANLS